MSYKKASDVENTVNDLVDHIFDMDVDIHDNPNILTDVKECKKKLSDIEKSWNFLPKDAKKDLAAVLRQCSTLLQSATLAIFQQHIEQYIINDFLWYLLAKTYATSPTPEDFTELCKNNVALSHDEKFALATMLIDKMIFVVMKDVLQDVGDWDDERKHDLVQKTRTKYPNASNGVNHLLISKSKWNTIKQDFLVATKIAFTTMLQQESAFLLYGDVHDVMDALSMFFLSFIGEKAVDDIFSKYVEMFLEEQFQKSDQRNTSKYDQKVSSTQTMLASALLASQAYSRKLKPLPDGLKDEINQYLLAKKINVNCTKLLSFIEKNLQKFLTRNDSIRKQWFKEKISSCGSDCIDDDFFVLLERYGFSCVDVCKWPSEEIPDVESVECTEEIPANQEQLSDEKNTLLATLNSFDVVRWEWESKKEYLLKKMRWYADIFEKLGYTFDAKEKFIESTAEYCHSNARLDKEIKKIIYDLIVKNKQEQKKIWRNYYTFEMPNWWRILLYKKGVISSAWPHDYYERHLKNNY